MDSGFPFPNYDAGREIMTRAQSMDVINDATTLESRIDAVLSAPIMEWDHSPEIQWQPGDPLWKHPNDRGDEIFSFASPVLERPHGWIASLPAQGGGNCPRHMFEIIGLDEYVVGTGEDGAAEYQTYFSHDDTMDGEVMDCDDCLVGVGNDERHCWNCGKMLWLMTKNEMQAAHRKHQFDPLVMFWEGIQRANAAEDRRRDELILASSAFRGQRADYVVLDEWSSNLSDIEWDVPEMPYPTDFVDYTFADVMAMQVLYNNQHRLNIYDDSLNIEPTEPAPRSVRDIRIFLGDSINTPRRNGRTEWMNDWLQIRLEVEQGLHDWRKPAEFEVPRINLRDTNPDLYRSGYERYFTNQTPHDPRTSERFTS